MLTTISHKELTLLRSAFLNAQIDPKEFRSITKKTLGDTQLFGYEIKYAKRKIYKFMAHPNTEISKFINAYKSASSRLLKKEFPQIRQKLWKEYFWSQSFCLLTTGGAPIEVIKRYIESQGQKDRKRK